MKKWNLFILSLFVLLLVSCVAMASDFYVSTSGEDTIDNGSEENPFRSVTYALTVADTSSGRPHQIFVDNGRYTGSTEFYPLPMIDETTIIGEDTYRTILDASNSQTSVIAAIDASDWSIQNLTITGGQEIQGGGLLITQGSDVFLKKLIIKENMADYHLVPGTQGEGGGLFLYECDNVTIENVIFTQNSAVTNGGAIMATRCSPELNNVTIVSNSCYDNPNSSAIYSNGTPGNAVEVNSAIIWANTGIDGLSNSIDGEVNISYSLVENETGTAITGTGNIWTTPLFYDFESQDFRVLEGSEAVDSGDPSADYANEPTPNGSRVNMGAFGNSDVATISGSQFELRQNRWSFIGLPVDSEDGDPGLLFSEEMNDLSTGDDTWRFMRWSGMLDMFLRYDEPEADGVERGDPPDMTPGMGYLMRQNMFSRRDIYVPGYALDQSETYGVALETTGSISLNMVANPFPYPINLVETHLGSGALMSTFDEAAEAGSVNRWAYRLDNYGRFVPTLGSLEPWEGAVIVTLDETPMSWNIDPERNEAVEGDPFLGLDWGLELSATAIDTNGNPLVIDDGHIFGLGRDNEDLDDDFDPYDALSLNLLETPFTFHWETIGGDALFHDLRSGDDEYYPMWHGVVIGDESMPDTVLIELFGINNDTLDTYPAVEYGLMLKSETFEPLIDDLRDSTHFKLPLETLDDNSKYLSFYIYATHPDWVENDVDEESGIIPTEFAVESVYPNPFNASTSVIVRLNKAGDVKMAIYDVLGRQVEKRVYKNFSAGNHRINWTPENMASGVYFLRLESANISVARKLVLVR